MWKRQDLRPVEGRTQGPRTLDGQGKRQTAQQQPDRSYREAPLCCPRHYPPLARAHTCSTRTQHRTHAHTHGGGHGRARTHSTCMHAWTHGFRHIHSTREYRRIHVCADTHPKHT